MSGLRSFESYHRGMDGTTAFMSPFALLLKVLKIGLLIKKTIETVISDPGEFTSRLVELTKSATQLAQYLPQVTVPIMIHDVLDVTNELLRMILLKIEEIRAIQEKKVEVSAKVNIDPKLSFVLVKINLQENDAQSALVEMLEPVIVVFDIIKVFCDLIGAPSPIASLGADDLDLLKTKIEALRAYITSLLNDYFSFVK
jgi:hypothetical protein